MPQTLIFILVVLPFLIGLVLYADRTDSLRQALVLATAVLLTIAALFTCSMILQSFP